MKTDKKLVEDQLDTQAKVIQSLVDAIGERCNALLESLERHDTIEFAEEDFNQKWDVLDILAR